VPAQGNFCGLIGWSLDGELIAEEFSLSSSVTISHLRFWIFSSRTSEWNGTIYWRIYGNRVGAPDDLNPVASGNAIPKVVFTGKNALQPGSDFQLDLELGAMDLSPGHYWLALHNGPIESPATQPHDALWLATAFPGRSLRRPVPLNSSSWSPAEHRAELAFQLFGPDEP
jgi:hypothetical protein